MEDRDRQDPLARDALEPQCDVEFVRASGPGGQHRNKRCTGVRLTHQQSGIVVLATERRSQARNLGIAYQRLAERLRDAAYRPPPRRPTRKSGAVKRRRLDAKRRRGQTKLLRRRPDEG